MTRRILLSCGLAASVLYFAMNVGVPILWDGYNAASQTVSELSAIGAPTRTLWVGLGIPYTLLLLAFGIGVWLEAGEDRQLRRAGAAILASGALNVFWPPMHLRGAEFTLTDTLHIVWSVATVVLMLLTILFAAAALGRRFRRYSLATVVVLLGFGGLTALDAPRIAANLPTPLVGVWERISIGVLFVWMVGFAIALLGRAGSEQEASVEPPSKPEAARPTVRPAL